MSFLDTLSQMSALFLMVLIGYGCNRLGYMDKDFNRKFSSLILNVTAPFLILSSVMGEVLPKPEDIAKALSLQRDDVVAYGPISSRRVFQGPSSSGSIN